MHFLIVAGLLALLGISHEFPANQVELQADSIAESSSYEAEYLGEQGPYYEGDIVMTEDEIAEWKMSSKSGLSEAKYRWEDATVIIRIHNDIAKDLTKMKVIQQAQNLIIKKTGGCIKFKPWTVREKDYVHIIPDASLCNSALGKRGGAQELRLASGCFLYEGGPGTVAHELIHALGVDHEQNRKDRDKYVEILTKNIKAGKEHNFKISDLDVLKRNFSTFNLAYDYGSIMHYAAYDFSGKNDTHNNPLPTIRVKDGKSKIGQRMDLSDLDAKRLKIMYKKWCKN